MPALPRATWGRRTLRDTLISIEAASGSAFTDTLTGGDGDDILNGFGGNDLDNRIVGFTEENIIASGRGNDVLYGGEGNDVFRFDSVPTAVTNAARFAISN